MEGSQSITVITDHATLRHLPKATDAEKLAKIPRRYIPWLAVLSPYLAVHPVTNQPILKQIYRRRKDNEADALSRRPDLVDQIEKYDSTSSEIELEELQTHLSAMTHLMFDTSMLNKIRVAASRDPALHKGVVYSEREDFYYFDDKLYVPNDSKLIEDILYEFHDTIGHPSAIRTLANVCQIFYFPRMTKIVKKVLQKMHCV